MHTDSVRTDGPPGQATELVPSAWTYIGDWDTDDRVGIELYIHVGYGVGRLIAIPQGGEAVCAATIVDADWHATFGWTGEIDRDAEWQNTQRSTALTRYNSFKKRRRP